MLIKARVAAEDTMVRYKDEFRRVENNTIKEIDWKILVTEFFRL